LKWLSVTLLAGLSATPASGDLNVAAPAPGARHVDFRPYRVDVSEPTPHEELLTIRDRAGRILYELRDAGIEVSLMDVTGDGVPELRVINDPHGSCCRGTEHFFTREGGFRELFAVDRGRGEGLSSVRDLDGDGRPELIFDVTLWASDYIHCTSSPECRLSRVVVVGWDGRGYVDRTRRFPSLSRKLARDYRDALVDPDNFHRQQALAGYLGNSVLAGDDAPARRWILDWARKMDLSDADREWLGSRAKTVREEFLANPLAENN
jgi:hypothetical protein